MCWSARRRAGARARGPLPRLVHTELTDDASTSGSWSSSERRDMSGHSKWSSIKHRREPTRSGKLFSKLTRAIIVAAREGGPAGNATLATAIQKGARQLDAEGQHRARSPVPAQPPRGVLRDRHVRGLRRRRRGCLPRRGADGQPQPHRGRCPHLRRRRQPGYERRRGHRNFFDGRGSSSSAPTRRTRTSCSPWRPTEGAEDVELDGSSRSSPPRTPRGRAGGARRREHRLRVRRADHGRQDHRRGRGRDHGESSCA